MENKIYNYPNSGIDRMIEQMQQSIKPIVNMINSTAYQNSIQLASTAYVESCKIMQQCLKSNVVENIIEPTLSLYREQMSRILEVIPTIMTDNLYNTLSAYKNILNEINFSNLIINDNGTIEYEGDIFTEDEIEETSDEIVEEINTKGKIEIESVLKKLMFCIIGTFLISFLQADDLKYLFLMMFGGFLSQPGADAYSFFKDKFIRIFKKESITNDYFDNYSGLVQIDNLKLRKKPNKDAKIIANLQFGSSIEIKEQLGSWIEINYCIDEDNNTYISGWVYANGIKRIKKIKNKLIS